MARTEEETIGDCKLYLGDCRQILPTFADKSIDLVFTDPPYGIMYKDKNSLSARISKVIKERRKETIRQISNDDKSADSLVRFVFEQSGRILKNGCCICCCCGGGGGKYIKYATWTSMLDEIMNFKQMIIWDKGPIGLGWHYRMSYEIILVAQNGNGKCRWFDTSRKVENIIRHGAHGIKKIIPQKHMHPTEKPVELSEFFIKLHTKVGDVVLDPFMGGGSTLLACAKLGRRGIGIEIEQIYYDMARRRLDDFYNRQQKLLR